jgi:hypothetical protein
MGLRERFSGEWWWPLTMEVHGKGGVLVSLLRCMGWVYGRILGGVGESFLDLRWAMAPRLDFDMIFGAGIWPLRMSFQFYLVLLAQKMLLLQFTSNFLEVLFSEM